ncbi:glycosyltransferase family 87 protein [Microlunatus soli]|uniref:DUF2029 domain-containing protein n=1 Tax=Microlunatus soli TaxID=630515 RepID=A0A1H1ZT56_9ACTN|nr:glycosyltransferase family 87 protein [Microlunatus soli]SDT36592.1 Protein of unknown function [Microlunatus soli]
MSNLSASAPGTGQSRIRAGLEVVLPWLVSRAIMVLLAATIEHVATGDVNYYYGKIDALSNAGLSQTLNEYPTPVVWMLSIPYALGIGRQGGYQIAFIGLMLLLDAFFTFLLWRAAGRRRDAAVTFWLAFIFLIGPLCYLRFDLVPAVLAGVSVLLGRRRPWLTGVLTGVGAAIKLWPALLIAPFAAPRQGRRATLIGFVAAGFGLALISLITGGIQRLVSPLGWQSDRGLQIESIWATPLMVLRLVDTDRWTVTTSRYQAFEVFGPGVGLWLTISTIATVLGLIFMILLYIRGFRHPEPSITVTGLIVLSTIAIMIITNKTLSPQYLVWIGGPMAALLIGRVRDQHGRLTVISRFAVQALVLALLTHLVYPLTYFGLYGDRHGAQFVASTILLLLRNLGLLIFTIALAAAAWRATGQHRIAAAPGDDPAAG